jgi:hypothetical protein
MSNKYNKYIRPAQPVAGGQLCPQHSVIFEIGKVFKTFPAKAE